jgi:hypothetical protein
MPSVLPTISEITTRISMIGKLTRSPVMICGKQAGSITCQTVFARDRPKVLAVFKSTQSTLRTPSMVLSNIGQAQKKDHKDFHLVAQAEKEQRHRDHHRRWHR